MRSIFYILIILLIGFVSLAQKPMVHLTVDPKTAEVGEVISITVKTNLEGKIDIDFPNAFVQGYNVMSGIEQESDYASGRIVTYQYLSQTGSINKEGTFTIGPAFVKKGNKVYKSNTVTVKVEQATQNEEPEKLSRRQLREPAFGEIKKSKSKVYEGEAVVLNSRIYAHFSPTHLEGYETYKTDRPVEKYEFGNKQNIVVQEQRIKRSQLYTFEYDKKVIFPVGPGKLSIEPFKMILRSGFESYPVTSAGTSIEVVRLPSNAPKSFTGGVGNFTFSRVLNKRNFEQGEVLVMSLIVKGTGNLQNLSMPEIKLPKGFIIYGDPIIETEYEYGPNGADGAIIFNYNIQITSHGNITLPIISLSYFDPEKEQYQILTIPSESIAVKEKIGFETPSNLTQNKSGTQSESSQKQSFVPLTASKKQSFIIDSPLFWLGLISPLAIVLLFGIRVKYRAKNQDKIHTENIQREAHVKSKQEFEKAKEYLNSDNSDKFYACIQKAVIEQCTGHLNLERDLVLSKFELFHLLEERGVKSALLNDLDALFMDCENARFGFENNTTTRETIYDKALSITNQIEKQLNDN